MRHARDRHYVHPRLSDRLHLVDPDAQRCCGCVLRHPRERHPHEHRRRGRSRNGGRRRVRPQGGRRSFGARRGHRPHAGRRDPRSDRHRRVGPGIRHRSHHGRKRWGVVGGVDSSAWPSRLRPRTLGWAENVNNPQPGGLRVVLRGIRRRPTLPGGLPPSTIGAISLNFRVRDGNGCDPDAMATEILCLSKVACALFLRTTEQARTESFFGEWMIIQALGRLVPVS